MTQFSYDEVGVFNLLPEKEWQRAIDLNYKGSKEGLSDDELYELASFFKRCTEIIHPKQIYEIEKEIAEIKSRSRKI